MDYDDTICLYCQQADMKKINMVLNRIAKQLIIAYYSMAGL